MTCQNNALGLHEDAKTRILFITAYDAVSLFLERYMRNNEHATYKDILEELRKRFSSMSNKHSAQQALRHLSQQHSDNIQTFYEKVLDLAEQVFPDEAMND